MNLKNLILCLLLCFTQLAFSQGNPFGLTLEYAPNFSRLTNTTGIENFKISHNYVLRYTHKKHGHFNPTVGLGLLNTGEMQFQDFANQVFQGQIEIESVHHYNYLYIPIVVKIKYAKFYIHPEIGLGVLVSNKMQEFTKRPWISNERIIETRSLDPEKISALTVPLLLSIGRDFQMGNVLFSTGIKGYYGLNKVLKSEPRNGHYFGVGLIVGITL